MGMTIDEPDNVWVRNLNQLNKLDKWFLIVQMRLQSPAWILM